MQIYLKKALLNKIYCSSKQGLLLGERFCDIFYINDIVNCSKKHIKNDTALISNIIGEYICYKNKPINHTKLFSKNDVQWIKLILTKNNSSVKIEENNECVASIIAFLKCLDNDQKKYAIKTLNVIIV